jgi:hypothetical protein
MTFEEKPESTIQSVSISKRAAPIVENAPSMGRSFGWETMSLVGRKITVWIGVTGRNAQCYHDVCTTWRLAGQ